MKICFIADSSSIHVQRIISYFVRKKDDILILSSAPYISKIPGTRTIPLLKTNKPTFMIPYENRKTKESLVTYLKSFVPVSLKILILDTLHGLRLLRKRRACVEEIQRFNPEVVFCNRSFPEGILAPYCHVRPLLLRTAGSDIGRLPKYPVYRQLVAKALRTADIVVTESIWEKKLLRRLCSNDLNPEAIVIGVDTALFRPPISKDNLRDKYGLPRDAFVVVCSRSLNGVYNGWLVVEAIQTVLEQSRDLMLLYLSPSRMDPETKAKAKAVATRFPRIRFLDRRVPHDEMPDILGCGDIYISFSSYDGVPNSVLEAMGCGVVPVVAELPQLHEWIEHGKSGYFVPQNDVKGLASVVLDLYKDREILPKMARRCVAKIREHGSYEECMERTRELLAQLANPMGLRNNERSVSYPLKASFPHSTQESYD